MPLWKRFLIATGFIAAESTEPATEDVPAPDNKKTAEPAPMPVTLEPFIAFDSGLSITAPLSAASPCEALGDAIDKLILANAEAEALSTGYGMYPTDDLRARSCAQLLINPGHRVYEVMHTILKEWDIGTCPLLASMVANSAMNSLLETPSKDPRCNVVVSVSHSAYRIAILTAVKSITDTLECPDNREKAYANACARIASSDLTIRREVDISYLFEDNSDSLIIEPRLLISQMAHRDRKILSRLITGASIYIGRDLKFSGPSPKGICWSKPADATLMYLETVSGVRLETPISVQAYDDPFYDTRHDPFDTQQRLGTKPRSLRL